MARVFTDVEIMAACMDPAGARVALERELNTGDVLRQMKRAKSRGLITWNETTDPGVRLARVTHLEP